MSENIEYVADETVHNHPFTIIPNELLDSTLSPTAFRLITHMISKPPRWKFHNHKLLEVCQCSEKKLKAVIRELKEFGYMKTVALRDDRGSFLGSKRMFASRPIFKTSEIKASAEGVKKGQSVKGTVPKRAPEVSNTERVSNTKRNINSSRGKSDTIAGNTKQDPAVVSFLAEIEEWGVTHEDVFKWVNTYGFERFKEAIIMTRRATPANPGGYLRSTLTKGWKRNSSSEASQDPEYQRIINNLKKTDELFLGAL